MRTSFAAAVVVVVVVVVATALSAPSCAAALESQIDEPQLVTLVTQDNTLNYAMEKHVDAFRNLTGHTVRVQGVPRAQLFDSIHGDLQLGAAGNYDGFLMSPQWIADLQDCSLLPCYDLDDDANNATGTPRQQRGLEALNERVRLDAALDWADVSDFFRFFSSSFQGEVVALPLDGDIHFVYYRTDVLAAAGLEPPRTWTEYNEVAARLFAVPAAERDYNSDGVFDDTPSCIAKTIEFVAQFFVWDFAAPTLQSRGTSHGLFFDPESPTFEPLLDTDGFRRAMTLLRNSSNFATIDELALDLDGSRDMFKRGACAMTIDWGDIPAIVKDTPFRRKVTQLILPGDTHVYDRTDRVVRACTVETCPHAVDYGDGVLVNHAPFAAFGGWSGSVSGFTTPARKQVAYEFFSFMSQSAQSNDDITDGGSGIQPYRTSHLDRQLWLDAGFPRQLTNGMLSGLTSTLRSPNLVLDLRVPLTSEYTGVTDELAVRMFADEITPAQLSTQLAARFNDISRSAPGGVRSQVQLYRASIGLAPLDFTREVTVSRGAEIAIVVVCALLIAFVLGVLVFMLVRRAEKVWRCSSIPYMGAVLVGALLVYTALIIFSNDKSTGACTTALWFVVVGFTLMLSCILAKTYRIWAVFRDQNTMRAVVLTNVHLIPIVGAIVGATVLLLIVWSAIDAPTAVETTKGVAELEYVVVCDSPEHGEALFITLFVWLVTLLILTLTLSFTTRNVAAAFNESKPLSLCVYNQLQALIILIVAVFALDEPTARFVLVAVSIIFGTTITVLMLFVPKLYRSLRGKGNEVSLYAKSVQESMTSSRDMNSTTPVPGGSNSGGFGSSMEAEGTRSS